MGVRIHAIMPGDFGVNSEKDRLRFDGEKRPPQGALHPLNPHMGSIHYGLAHGNPRLKKDTSPIVNQIDPGPQQEQDPSRLHGGGQTAEPPGQGTPGEGQDHGEGDEHHPHPQPI